MHKIIFANNTEFEINEDSVPGEVNITVSSLETLSYLKSILNDKNNLTKVVFTVDGKISAVFNNVLVGPLLIPLNEDGDMIVRFTLSESIDLLGRLKDLEQSQEIQAGAIVELASIIGGE